MIPVLPSRRGWVRAKRVPRRRRSGSITAGTPVPHWIGGPPTCSAGVIGSTGADIVGPCPSPSTVRWAIWFPWLVSTVAVGGPTLPREEFLAGIDRDAAPGGSFDHALLTDIAVTHGVREFASTCVTACAPGWDGLRRHPIVGRRSRWTTCAPRGARRAGHIVVGAAALPGHTRRRSTPPARHSRRIRSRPPEMGR